MSLEDALRKARHDDEAAKMGRRTAWERAVDAGDYEYVAPAPDCFACKHLRASDACGQLATLAMGRFSKAVANEIVALTDYRAIGHHDPHALCPSFELRPDLIARPPAE